jgi:diguanylate cyclase (GGDEF)-like protein
VERKATPLAILLADLDDFKQINDTHGHVIGDAVLRDASKRLGTPMRPYDAVGRYGGEEFLIVLPGCDMTNALQVAERVRAFVASKPLETPSGTVAITVSLGVAAVEKGQATGVDQLIVAADEALYRAKHAGRNRVEGPKR